jgi:CRP-like cAMP-binding protein
MKKDIVNIIGAKAGIFKDVPRDELLKLFALKKKMILKKNEYFLKAGDVPKRIGFNASGLLRLFYTDSSGKDITKHFCTEFSLAISYSAFIQSEPSKMSIQALEDTKLYTITHEDYIHLLKSHPCWQIAARKLAEVIFFLKEKREAELLLMDAPSRYQSFLNDFPGFANRIPQYYIASYLGITPESLSRIRSSYRN